MEIRDKYNAFRSKVGSWFGRKNKGNNPATTSEFVRSEKRSLWSRTLGGLGKLVGNIAYYGATIGTLGILPAVSYYRTTPEQRVWPYRENDQNAYVIKQNFDGTPAGVIGPKRTERFNSPFERDAKLVNEDGGLVSNVVSAIVQERASEFEVSSKQALGGMFRLQYLWQPDGEDGAEDWYWRYAADARKIDEVVRGVVTNVLGSVDISEIMSGRFEDEKTRDYIAKQTGLKFDDTDTLLRTAEKIANKILRREGYGVRVTNLSRESIKLNDRTEEILSRGEAGKQEAEYLRKKAVGQYDATIKNAEATAASMDKYTDAIGKFEGLKPVEKKMVLQFMDWDNNQEIEGGTVVKVGSSLGDLLKSI